MPALRHRSSRATAAQCSRSDMEPLSLDYQRKARRPASRPGLLVLLLGLIAVFVVADFFVQVNRQKSDLENQLASKERKRAPVTRGTAERDNKRTAEDLKLADSIAERLTIPWSNLFDALETSSTSAVALLALEPDVSKRLLRITAEAKDKNDMLDYVRRLSDDPRLVNVHLMDHQLQAQTPGEPVRFSIQASWAGASRRGQN
jgi:Tfp pilus assembly protein PilN